MLLIADNLQITNKSVAQAVAESCEKTIQDLVLSCIDAGCDALDINSGPLASDPEKKMAFLVESVQQ